MSQRGGEEILIREQSDMRDHNPQLHNGWRKRLRTDSIPMFSGCKGDNGIFVHSDLQGSFSVTLQ